MLYKNTNKMIHSLKRDTVIVAGILQDDTITPYLFIICQDYVIQTTINLIKGNGLALKKKAWSRLYPAETMTNTDNTDHRTQLANIPAQ